MADSGSPERTERRWSMSPSDRECGPSVRLYNRRDFWTDHFTGGPLSPGLLRTDGTDEGLSPISDNSGKRTFPGLMAILRVTKNCAEKCIGPAIPDRSKNGRISAPASRPRGPSLARESWGAVICAGQSRSLAGFSCHSRGKTRPQRFDFRLFFDSRRWAKVQLIEYKRVSK